MAVSWVAASAGAFAFGTTVTHAAPSGIEAGDTLLAAVLRQSTLTAPAGWSLLHSSGEFSLGTGATFYLELYEKDVVISANSGESFTFEQELSGNLYLLFTVTRESEPDLLDEVVASSANVWTIAPASLTAAEDGSMLVAFAISMLGATSGRTPPSGMTLAGGGDTPNLGVAYLAANTGQANSGSFDFRPGAGTPSSIFGTTNGLASITVRLAPAAAEVPPPEGWVAAPTPLGSAAVLAQQLPHQARIAVASPLKAPLVLAFHNFSAAVEGRPLRYVADLETPGGLVRAPISSWQATLQTEGSNYLQVVVPACEPFLDAITTATRVRVSRRAVLQDGTAFEYEMASVALQTANTARGANNYTATLSGYSPGAVLVASPPGATARELQDVRTVFTAASGLRIRCAIDWLLRPAQIALFNGTPFVVAFINYYVTDGDQYMDVGERVGPD